MITFADLAGGNPAIKNSVESLQQYDPKLRRKVTPGQKKKLVQFGIATITTSTYAFAVASSDGALPFMDVVAGATAQRVWRMSYTGAGILYDIFV